MPKIVVEDHDGETIIKTREVIKTKEKMTTETIEKEYWKDRRNNIKYEENVKREWKKKKKKKKRGKREKKIKKKKKEES